jgi:hypothetical protein
MIKPSQNGTKRVNNKRANSKNAIVKSKIYKCCKNLQGIYTDMININKDEFLLAKDEASQVIYDKLMTQAKLNIDFIKSLLEEIENKN